MVWLRPLALKDIVSPADPVLSGALSLIDLLGLVSSGIGIEHDPTQLEVLVEV
jgi:hypothetical protein